MTDIILQNDTNTKDGFRLSVREHDMSGTEYFRICSLSGKQAWSIAGDHTGIFFLHSQPAPDHLVVHKPLRIERVKDRKPNRRAWLLFIGDEPVTATNSEGETIAIRLSDGSVDSLEKNAKPVFEPGQPDWDLREVEDVEDRAVTLHQQASEMQIKADKARDKWEHRHHVTDTMPTDRI